MTVGATAPDALSLTLAVTCALASPSTNVGGAAQVTAGSVRSTRSGAGVSSALLPAVSVAVPTTVCGSALSASVACAV